MSYDNRGWGPNGNRHSGRDEFRAAPSTDTRGRGRGEMRAASNIDTYTSAPADPRAARGNNVTGTATVPALTFFPSLKGSTGNVDKEQANTPDLSKGIWARAVAANQPTSSPTGNTDQQTRDESILFSSAGPVVVAMPAAVDKPLQSTVPTSSTASPLPSISNRNSNNMLGSTCAGSVLSRMVFGNAPAPSNNLGNTKEIVPSPKIMDFTFVALKERDHSAPGGEQEYQTITSQRLLSKYSLEELRLADYNQIASKQLEKPAAAGAPTAQFGISTPEASTLVKKLAGRSRLPLLKGPGIEVVVGSRPDLTGTDGSAETWCLSKALISHYSSTLKDACNREHDDSHDLRIMLSSEDPAIFELFVEWINNGTYTLETPTPATRQPGVNIDAQAWVLGDRLGSVQFKNYAMGRLYAQYTSAFKPRPIITADANYAHEQSAYDSKLRMLFCSLLAVYFLDRSRTVGSTAEWDDSFQKHPELRMWVLTAMRTGLHNHKCIQRLNDYIEVEKAQPAPATQVSNGSMVVPAKRNVDGVPVKKELMDA